MRVISSLNLSLIYAVLALAFAKATAESKIIQRSNSSDAVNFEVFSNSGANILKIIDEFRNENEKLNCQVILKHLKDYLASHPEYHRRVKRCTDMRNSKKKLAQLMSSRKQLTQQRNRENKPKKSLLKKKIDKSANTTSIDRIEITTSSVQRMQNDFISTPTCISKKTNDSKVMTTLFFPSSTTTALPFTKILSLQTDNRQKLNEMVESSTSISQHRIFSSFPINDSRSSNNSSSTENEEQTVPERYEEINTKVSNVTVENKSKRKLSKKADKKKDSERVNRPNMFTLIKSIMQGGKLENQQNQTDLAGNKHNDVSETRESLFLLLPNLNDREKQFNEVGYEKKQNHSSRLNVTLSVDVENNDFKTNQLTDMFSMSNKSTTGGNILEFNVSNGATMTSKTLLNFSNELRPNQTAVKNHDLATRQHNFTAILKNFTSTHQSSTTNEPMFSHFTLPKKNSTLEEKYEGILTSRTTDEKNIVFPIENKNYSVSNKLIENRYSFTKGGTNGTISTENLSRNPWLEDSTSRTRILAVNKSLQDVLSTKQTNDIQQRLANLEENQESTRSLSLTTLSAALYTKMASNTTISRFDESTPPPIKKSTIEEFNFTPAKNSRIKESTISAFNTSFHLPLENDIQLGNILPEDKVVHEAAKSLSSASLSTVLIPLFNRTSAPVISRIFSNTNSKFVKTTPLLTRISTTEELNSALTQNSRTEESTTVFAVNTSFQNLPSDNRNNNIRLTNTKLNENMIHTTPLLSASFSTFLAPLFHQTTATVNRKTSSRATSKSDESVSTRMDKSKFTVENFNSVQTRDRWILNNESTTTSAVDSSLRNIQGRNNFDEPNPRENTVSETTPITSARVPTFRVPLFTQALIPVTENLTSKINSELKESTPLAEKSISMINNFDFTAKKRNSHDKLKGKISFYWPETSVVIPTISVNSASSDAEEAVTTGMLDIKNTIYLSKNEVLLDSKEKKKNLYWANDKNADFNSITNSPDFTRTPHVTNINSLSKSDFNHSSRANEFIFDNSEFNNKSFVSKNEFEVISSTFSYAENTNTMVNENSETGSILKKITLMKARNTSTGSSEYNSRQLLESKLASLETTNQNRVTEQIGTSPAIKTNEFNNQASTQAKLNNIDQKNDIFKLNHSNFNLVIDQTEQSTNHSFHKSESDNKYSRGMSSTINDLNRVNIDEKNFDDSQQHIRFDQNFHLPNRSENETNNEKQIIKGSMNQNCNTDDDNDNLNPLTTNKVVSYEMLFPLQKSSVNNYTTKNNFNEWLQENITSTTVSHKFTNTVSEPLKHEITEKCSSDKNCDLDSNFEDLKSSIGESLANSRRTLNPFSSEKNHINDDISEDNFRVSQQPDTTGNSYTNKSKTTPTFSNNYLEIPGSKNVSFKGNYNSNSGNDVVESSTLSTTKPSTDTFDRLQISKTVNSTSVQENNGKSRDSENLFENEITTSANAQHSIKSTPFAEAKKLKNDKITTFINSNSLTFNLTDNTTNILTTKFNIESTFLADDSDFENRDQKSYKESDITILHANGESYQYSDPKSFTTTSKYQLDVAENQLEKQTKRTFSFGKSTNPVLLVLDPTTEQRKIADSALAFDTSPSQFITDHANSRNTSSSIISSNKSMEILDGKSSQLLAKDGRSLPKEYYDFRTLTDLRKSTVKQHKNEKQIHSESDNETMTENEAVTSTTESSDITVFPSLLNATIPPLFNSTFKRPKKIYKNISTTDKNQTHFKEHKRPRLPPLNPNDNWKSVQNDEYYSLTDLILSKNSFPSEELPEMSVTTVENLEPENVTNSRIEFFENDDNQTIIFLDSQDSDMVVNKTVKQNDSYNQKESEGSNLAAPHIDNPNFFQNSENESRGKLPEIFNFATEVLPEISKISNCDLSKLLGKEIQNVNTISLHDKNFNYENKQTNLENRRIIINALSNVMFNMSKNLEKTNTSYNKSLEILKLILPSIMDDLKETVSNQQQGSSTNNESISVGCNNIFVIGDDSVKVLEDILQATRSKVLPGQNVSDFIQTAKMPEENLTSLPNLKELLELRTAPHQNLDLTRSNTKLRWTKDFVSLGERSMDDSIENGGIKEIPGDPTEEFIRSQFPFVDPKTLRNFVNVYKKYDKKDTITKKQLKSRDRFPDENPEEESASRYRRRSSRSSNQSKESTNDFIVNTLREVFRLRKAVPAALVSYSKDNSRL